jgi:hypothetical protein
MHRSRKERRDRREIQPVLRLHPSGNEIRGSSRRLALPEMQTQKGKVRSDFMMPTKQLRIGMRFPSKRLSKPCPVTAVTAEMTA